MPNIKLEALEYTITFDIQPHKFSNRVMVSISMENKSITMPQVIESIETSVEKNNLSKLCQYLKQHGDGIKNGKYDDADLYFDHDQLFSVRAYIGNYNVEKKRSAYSMLFLINTGYPQKRKRAIWMGGKIFVYSNDIEQFTIDMKKAIDAVSQE